MVFFRQVNPSIITTSKIPKSPEVRFLIAWSNLNHFLVKQPVLTNSMQFPSTHTSHSQHLQSDLCLESRRKFVVELFCGNSLHVNVVGCFCRGAPLLMFDGVLNATWSEEKASTTGVELSFFFKKCVTTSRAATHGWWDAPLPLWDFSRSNK